MKRTTTLKALPGLNSVKQLLVEWIVLPLKFPQLFVANWRHPLLIQLNGPSGSGKSQLIAACAEECLVPLYSVSCEDLIREPNSERSIREVFSHARSNAPAVLLISHIEAMCSDEEHDYFRRLNTELLINLTPHTNENNQLLIVLTCTTPWHQLRALRRRVEREVYVPLPDAVRRRAMLQKAVQLASEAEYCLAADLAEGLSFWEIQRTVCSAMLHSATTDPPIPLLNALTTAFRLTSPSTDALTIEHFQTYVTERSD